jgi:hypothetical protein
MRSSHAVPQTEISYTRRHAVGTPFTSAAVRGVIVKRVVWISLYLLVPVLSLGASLGWLDGRAERALAGELPERFPLVIVKDGKPKAIFASELKESPRDCAKPDSTPEPPRYRNPVFLSPTATRDWQQIGAPDCNYDHGRYGQYRVVASSRGRLTLEVRASCSDDYMNVGRYQVLEGIVRGLSHKHYFGPGVAMASMPVAGCVTVLVWGLMFTGRRFWLWYRARRSPHLAQDR